MASNETGEQSLFQRFFYKLVRFTVRVWFRLLKRHRETGAGHVPSQGAVLLVSNHISSLDPPLLAASVMHRHLRFMAKQELWRGRIMGWAFTNLGAFPVDRGSKSDTSAYRNCIGCLKRGEVLLIFPEGTRSIDGDLQEFQQGAARMIVANPDTLIVPVRIRGTNRALEGGLFKRAPVELRVVFGEGFRLTDLVDVPIEKKSLYQALSLEMFKRISSL